MNRHQTVRDAIEASLQTISAIARDETLHRRIELAADRCIESLKRGGKILFAGNGGSAADCQHMAGEFVSRLNFDRPGLCAFALTVDSSVMTAIGNDYGFDQVFSRQIESSARETDVLIAYSTSGNSANILRAVESAKKIGTFTLGMTGDRHGRLDDLCDLCIQVPSGYTPHIQEAHLIIGHILCGIVETRMFCG